MAYRAPILQWAVSRTKTDSQRRSMNILLFTTLHGRPGSLNLSRPRVYVPILLVLFTFLGLTGYAGYRLGLEQAEGRPVIAAAEIREALARERERVREEKLRLQADMDALALRLGRLQGEVLRLEGLGERLVEVARLDKDEFDFDSPPGQGGPEEAGVAVTEPRDLLAELDRIDARLESYERQFRVLESVLSERELKRAVRLSGRPVRHGWISSRYGRRTDPFTGRKAWHHGVDIAGRQGSEIVAVAAGVVTWAGERSGYGKLVEINHGNGYVTRYGHNSAILVRKGDRVEKGQPIARMGSTGRSTGPHVHFEVLRHGKTVNPARFLARR